MQKNSPDDSSLDYPNGMLLKIYSRHDSALIVFDSSSVTINLGLSGIDYCLSNILPG